MLAALLSGATLSAAAEAAGCDLTTVRARLEDPSFRAELELAREDVLRAVVDRIGHEAMRSVQVLAAIRDNPRAATSSRVRAADRLLQLALGTPSVEVNQTTVVAGSGAGTSPAAALAAFLSKVADRDQAVPPLELPEAIETTATERGPEQ